MLLGVAVGGRLIARDPNGHMLDFCELGDFDGLEGRGLFSHVVSKLRDSLIGLGCGGCFGDKRRFGRLRAVAVLQRKLLMRRQPAIDSSSSPRKS